MPKEEQPCVFFDRDGVVNASPGEGYVERWSDFHVLPGFVDALRVVSAAHYAAIVVTNQRGVARGIMTREEVETIHRNLVRTLKDRHQLVLTDILYCPHGPGECDGRKPLPGMFVEAARRHAVDLARSWMVGDRVTDMEAGKAAGCSTIFVGADTADGGADYRVAAMDQLAPLLKRIL